MDELTAHRRLAAAIATGRVKPAGRVRDVLKIKPSRPSRRRPAQPQQKGQTDEIRDTTNS
jgi:hypothetical protein